MAALQWVRVKAPGVFAADRSTERDHRKVSWRLHVQRMQPSGPWTTIATSAVQKRTAYEDAAAAFSAMKVSFSSRRDQSNVRALLLLKWFRPDGSDEAHVKLTIDNYSVDWTVGSPDFVFTGGSCWSAAD